MPVGMDPRANLSTNGQTNQQLIAIKNLPPNEATVQRSLIYHEPFNEEGSKIELHGRARGCICGIMRVR